MNHGIEEARAAARARRLYAAPGFRGAYLDGAKAKLRGLGLSSCPYRRGGWGSAYRAAWTRGWRSAPAPEIP